MTEKEKAFEAFTAAMQRMIKSTEVSLDLRVRKLMNAVDSKGIEYQTEMEIMDAYAYDEITDAERYRLLKALEFRQDRPRLKEDYMIRLCRQALRLIDNDRYADLQEQKKRDICNKAAEIKRNGGTPLVCGCCGDIIGEADRSGQRQEHQNYSECAQGRVCKECLRNCRSQCKVK